MTAVLAKAIENLKSKLAEENQKPSMAEFLKLVQVEKELEDLLNPAEEIRVQWVEPTSESEN